MRYTQQPYDPTANSGSIAELLMRSGQVQSEKLRDLAQIAATSQQQQGDAYARLGQNLGQIGTGAVGNYIDLRANEQKNTIAQQALAQRQQVNEANIAESQAATARTQALTAREQRADAEDVALKEKNRIATKIAAGLRDPDPQKREVVLGIIQDPETQDLARKMLLGRDKQNADYRAARAQFAAANGYDDDMVRIVVALDPMEGALAHFDKATNGGQDKAAVKQYVDAFWKKPTEPKFGTAAPGAQIYNEATGELGASVPAKPAVKPDFTLNGTRYDGETNQPMVTDKAAAADVTKLTPGGLDVAALYFRKNGTMPALGMGDKSTRQQIINRAAELTPDDIVRIEAVADIAGAKADYTANTASLKTLQGQRDAITAFENTAKKNLQVFLTAAGKVKDSGSPLLNKPLRAFGREISGDPNLAAYDTARRTVIPEFAKILNNPTMSGQLSDSARHEVEQILNGDATMAQTIAVANTLLQDADNRASSLDKQIKETRGRIGGGGGAAKTGTAPTAPAGWKYVPKPGGGWTAVEDQ